MILLYGYYKTMKLLKTGKMNNLINIKAKRGTAIIVNTEYF